MNKTYGSNFLYNVYKKADTLYYFNNIDTLKKIVEKINSVEILKKENAKEKFGEFLIETKMLHNNEALIKVGLERFDSTKIILEYYIGNLSTKQISQVQY